MKKPATKPAKLQASTPKTPRDAKPDRVAIAKRMIAFRKKLKLNHAGAASMADISLQSWECCEGATSPTRRATLDKVIALLDRWKDRPVA